MRWLKVHTYGLWAGPDDKRFASGSLAHGKARHLRRPSILRDGLHGTGSAPRGKDEGDVDQPGGARDVRARNLQRLDGSADTARCKTVRFQADDGGSLAGRCLPGSFLTWRKRPKASEKPVREIEGHSLRYRL
jgi:hypothetical protein